MNKDYVDEIVVNFVEKIFKIKVNDKNISFIQIGIDSLDIVCLISILENFFEIKNTNCIILNDIVSVNKIVTYICEKKMGNLDGK